LIRKQRIDKHIFRIDLSKAIIVLLLLLVIAFFAWEPIHKFVSEQGRIELKSKIEGFGPLAPVVYITIVFLHVLISIIPSQFIMLFGGFVFGSALGTLYSITGLVLGSAAAFYLGRKFGRPILEDLVESRILRKFDKKSEKKGLIMLLFIFLIPFTPDNAACLAAGLTKIRLKNLVAVAAIGRLPGTVVASMIGAGLGKESSAMAWSIIGGLSILLFAGYYYRKSLERLVRNLLHKRKPKPAK
jgi:uncharacterized membrane protein YdjX (TVP38/TMEM64 family)